MRNMFSFWGSNFPKWIDNADSHRYGISSRFGIYLNFSFACLWAAFSFNCVKNANSLLSEYKWICGILWMKRQALWLHTEHTLTRTHTNTHTVCIVVFLLWIRYFYYLVASHFLTLFQDVTNALKNELNNEKNRNDSSVPEESIVNLPNDNSNKAEKTDDIPGIGITDNIVAFSLQVLYILSSNSSKYSKPSSLSHNSEDCKIWSYHAVFTLLVTSQAVNWL